MRLPSSLKSLTMGLSFNSSLEGVAFSGTLQNLSVGASFKKSLEGVSLPSSLQSLAFGFRFSASTRDRLALSPTNRLSLQPQLGESCSEQPAEPGSRRWL
ncbi:unnamed protein product [Effrenium voratum]|nr:unnamed protein product [Effrenium voratum]